MLALLDDQFVYADPLATAWSNREKIPCLIWDRIIAEMFIRWSQNLTGGTPPGYILRERFVAATIQMITNPDHLKLFVMTNMEQVKDRVHGDFQTDEPTEGFKPIIVDLVWPPWDHATKTAPAEYTGVKILQELTDDQLRDTIVLSSYPNRLAVAQLYNNDRKGPDRIIKQDFPKNIPIFDRNSQGNALREYVRKNYSRVPNP